MSDRTFAMPQANEGAPPPAQTSVPTAYVRGTTAASHDSTTLPAQSTLGSRPPTTNGHFSRSHGPPPPPPPERTRLSAIQTLLAQLTEKQENASFSSHSAYCGDRVFASPNERPTERPAGRANERPNEQPGAAGLLGVGQSPLYPAALRQQPGSSMFPQGRMEAERNTVHDPFRESVPKPEPSLQELLQQLIMKMPATATQPVPDSTSGMKGGSARTPPCYTPLPAAHYGNTYGEKHTDGMHSFGTTGNPTALDRSGKVHPGGFDPVYPRNVTAGSNAAASTLLKSVLRIATTSPSAEPSLSGPVSKGLTDANPAFYAPAFHTPSNALVRSAFRHPSRPCPSARQYPVEQPSFVTSKDDPLLSANLLSDPDLAYLDSQIGAQHRPFHSSARYSNPVRRMSPRRVPDGHGFSGPQSLPRPLVPESNSGATVPEDLARHFLPQALPSFVSSPSFWPAQNAPGHHKAPGFHYGASSASGNVRGATRGPPGRQACPAPGSPLSSLTQKRHARARPPRSLRDPMQPGAFRPSFNDAPRPYSSFGPRVSPRYAPLGSGPRAPDQKHQESHEYRHPELPTALHKSHFMASPDGSFGPSAPSLSGLLASTQRPVSPIPQGNATLNVDHQEHPGPKSCAGEEAVNPQESVLLTFPNAYSSTGLPHPPRRPGPAHPGPGGIAAGYNAFPVSSYYSGPQRRRSGRGAAGQNTFPTDVPGVGGHLAHTPRLYKLSLCLPITLPYGTVHVTKASGENFYSFSDTTRCPSDDTRENAEMLFSPTKGICDAWASFLQIRAGCILHVEAEHIAYIVDLFHAVMASSAEPGPLLFSKPITFYCKGLYVSPAPQEPAPVSGWKPKPTQFANASAAAGSAVGNSVPDKRLETRAFFEDSTLGPQQFQRLCEKLRLFKDALQAVYQPEEVAPAVAHSPDIQRSVRHFRSCCVTGGEDPAKGAMMSRRRTVGMAPRPVVHLGAPFSQPLATDPSSTGSFEGLPIIVREYGQVQNKDLEESFIGNSAFADQHRVPGVQVAEIRIEHQSKKMVDPRFGENLVLTRQMAGDENPQQWNDSKKLLHNLSAADRATPGTLPQKDVVGNHDAAILSLSPSVGEASQHNNSPQQPLPTNPSLPTSSDSVPADVSATSCAPPHQESASTDLPAVKQVDQAKVSEACEVFAPLADTVSDTAKLPRPTTPVADPPIATTDTHPEPSPTTAPADSAVPPASAVDVVVQEKTQERHEADGRQQADERVSDATHHQEGHSVLADHPASSSLQANTAESRVKPIGRYQFCHNADLPAVEIAYRDAKDCFSSTHGFIYMRHLMAQQQRA